jgi:DNA-directed RNA polymerase subunit RPC12/RpoP
MEVNFVCAHCGLKGTYVQGGLMFASQFVAFCPNDRFVHISWEHHKRQPTPVRVGGATRVFVCPVCKKPTARQWDERECPRCGSRRFTIHETGTFVD